MNWSRLELKIGKLESEKFNWTRLAATKPPPASLPKEERGRRRASLWENHPRRLACLAPYGLLAVGGNSVVKAAFHFLVAASHGGSSQRVLNLNNETVGKLLVVELARSR